MDAIPYDEMWEDDRLWLPMALEGTPFRVSVMDNVAREAAPSWAA